MTENNENIIIPEHIRKIFSGTAKFRKKGTITMLQTFKLGEWKIKFTGDVQNIRVVSNEREIVALDETYDAVGVLFLCDNGDIELKKTPWNASVKLSVKERKIDIVIEEDTYE
ncbi:hypothetical protein [Virgibacillus sp. 6R]|uniref:hypothetical protein n=1 Tax=Metabacillus sp. 22489 TaxID=3453928 RepID=UPI0011A04CD7